MVTVASQVSGAGWGIKHIFLLNPQQTSWGTYAVVHVADGKQLRGVKGLVQASKLWNIDPNPGLCHSQTHALELYAALLSSHRGYMHNMKM